MTYPQVSVAGVSSVPPPVVVLSEKASLIRPSRLVGGNTGNAQISPGYFSRWLKPEVKVGGVAVAGEISR